MKSSVHNLLLSSFISFAIAAPTSSVVPQNLVSRDAEPDDCAHFAYANRATVNCFYDYAKTEGNFLNYVIQINPTGQGSAGWCKGIMDNIKGECGGYASNIDYEHCDSNWQTQVLEFPNNQQASGIDFNFHWQWEWVEGDDERTCITTAIRKATCAATVDFINDACYMRWTI